MRPRVRVVLCAWPIVSACAAPVKNMQPSKPAVTSAPGASDSTPAPVNPGQSQALQAMLNDAVGDSHGFGGGVLRIVSDKGHTLWEGAAGHVGPPASPAMGIGTTFDIASITKTFTSVLVLQLAEEGRLDIDDSIARHLPPALAQGLLADNGKDISGDITVRHLLQHASGLPDYWKDPPYIAGGDAKDTESDAQEEADKVNAFLRAFLDDPNRFWQPEELLDYARKLAPQGTPGAQFHYCDTGYVLLGRLVEHVTGQSLAEAYNSRIFAPVGMKDTFLPFVPPHKDARPGSERFESALAISSQPRQSADWAGGGLVSSVQDLTLFVTALWRGELFEHPETSQLMQSFRPTDNAEVDYGLGLFHIVIGGDQGTLWGHDGHGNAFMYIWPEGKVAFVGTLNQVENDWWPLVWEAIQVLSER